MIQEISSMLTDLTHAWNALDPDLVTPFYAADYEGIDVNDPVPQRGPEGILRMVERYRRAFPDVVFTPQQVILEGDRAAVVWTASGTHQGEIMKIPATGRRVTVQGVSVLTLQDGQIKRGLYIWDVAGLLRALGLLPEL